MYEQSQTDRTGDAQLRDANEALPPVSVDQQWTSANALSQIPQPHQNWSQHARLLPFMEQDPLYNSINWTFGARWSDGDYVYPSNDPNPPDISATGGADSIPQMTVLIASINSFLCPSDTNPGATGQFSIGDQAKTVGSNNYPCNIGLNRRITGNVLGQTTVVDSWKLNGPNYVASSWDPTVNGTVTLATFQDGTSNTVIFSEWIKGGYANPYPPGKGLAIVYYYPNQLLSNAFPTDFQFKLACDNAVVAPANYQWGWKGEWWGYGGTSIYSHTQTPNRTSCHYSDFSSSPIAPGAAGGGCPRDHHLGWCQLKPPGRRERPVHGRLGPLHQEHGGLPALVCHRHPELWRSVQLRLFLRLMDGAKPCPLIWPLGTATHDAAIAGCLPPILAPADADLPGKPDPADRAAGLDRVERDPFGIAWTSAPGLCAR